MKNKKFYVVSCLLLLLTAVGITVTTILFKQSFFMVAPLYVSLFIGLLQTRISRYAPLIGGFNSIYYALVYYHYGLLGNAFYAIAFSFPVQIATFILWHKKRWKGSTRLRKMSTRARVLVIFGFTALCVLAILLLRLLGSDYAALDAITALSGILCSFLTLFAFVEYTYVMIATAPLSICLYINMLINGVWEQTPYLIYNVYAAICTAIAVKQSHQLYNIQNKEANRDLA